MNKKYISEKYVKKLNEIDNNDVEADNILCEALTELGYNDIIDAYDKIFKWYA